MTQVLCAGRWLPPPNVPQLLLPPHNRCVPANIAAQCAKCLGGMQDPAESDGRVECGRGQYTLGRKDTAAKPLSINYAYYTRRGYYPDDETKPNQDAFKMIAGLDGRDDQLLLGVFDGHGHDCAAFVRDELEEQVRSFHPCCKSTVAPCTHCPRILCQPHTHPVVLLRLYQCDQQLLIPHDRITHLLAHIRAGLARVARPPFCCGSAVPCSPDPIPSAPLPAPQLLRSLKMTSAWPAALSDCFWQLNSTMHTEVRHTSPSPSPPPLRSLTPSRPHPVLTPSPHPIFIFSATPSAPQPHPPHPPKPKGRLF